MHFQNCKLIRVIDGDTIVAEIDLGFHVTTQQIFRLKGIDTHELRSNDEYEKIKAGQEKLFVERLLTTGQNMQIFSEKTEKFGRWLADVYYYNTEFLEYRNLSDDIKKFMNREELEKENKGLFE